MRRFGRSSTKALAAVLVFTALAAACGSDDSTVADSPLAGFLGQDLYGLDVTDEEAQARYAEEEGRRETAIAACMKDEGFEYVPRDTAQIAFGTTVDGLDWDSREYAEKYGFGITTERFSQEEVGPDLVGSRAEDAIDALEDDPNNVIVDAMNDAEREAYYNALYGEDDSSAAADPATQSDEQPVLEPQGCDGKAWADYANYGFYQEFDAELQTLYEAVAGDQRLADRKQEINQCVAGKGLDFPGLDQAGFEQLYARFEPELSRIEEMASGSINEDLTEEQLAAMTQAQLDELFNQPLQFTPEARESLAQLQADETDLAVAVWDCGGSNADNEELSRQVAAEYEEKFLAEYADRLAPFKTEK